MEGKIGTLLRLDPSPAGRGAMPAFQSGDKLTIRVLSRLGDGRYLVAVRGVRLHARSEVHLEVGSRLRAEVDPQGRIILAPAGTRLRPQVAPGAAAAGEFDGLSLRIVESLARSGLAATPEAISAVNAMVPQGREHDVEFLRFASLLFDKHLLVGKSGAETLYLALQGVSHEGGKEGGDGGAGSGSWRGESGQEADHHRGAGEGGQGGGGVSGQGAEGSGRERHEEGARRGLREQLMARAAGDFSPLALFNHAKGGRSTWIAVPFAIDREGDTLRGTIRLLVDAGRVAPSPGGPPSSRKGEEGAVSRRESALPVLMAAIIVPEERGGRSVYLIEGSPPGRLRIFSSVSSVRRKLARRLPLLAEKLRNLGLEIDDTISGDTEFDGFTADRREIKGIDTAV